MSSRRNRTIQPDRDNNYNDRNNSAPNNSQTNIPNNGQFDMNNLGQFLNNIDLNQVMGQLSQMMGNPQASPQGPAQAPPQTVRATPRDPRLELLQAVKPFLGPRRSDMVDRIGQFYLIASLLNKNKKR